MYAIHAISTYLLIYSALKQYKIGEDEIAKPIVPLIDRDSLDDLLNFSIDLNGLMYSRLLRGNYYDEKVIKYEKNLQREISHSALNGITLTCMVSSLELPSDPFYSFVKDSCILVILNIMDITTKNTIKLKKEIIAQHISTFANLAAGVLDMNRVMSKFEEYWELYKGVRVSKDPIKYTEIEDKKIYYTPIHGYVKISQMLIAQGGSAVKLTYGIPGKDWDDEMNDIACSTAYYCPPAKLYKVAGLK